MSGAKLTVKSAVGMTLVVLVLAAASASAQPTCSTYLLSYPTLTPMGPRIPVTWVVESTGTVELTEIRYRLATEMPEAEKRVGQRTGTGVFSTTVPTARSPEGVVLLLRSYARLAGGIECSSGYRTVLLLPNPEPVCTVDFVDPETTIPATIDRGTPLPVTYQFTSGESVTHTNVHVMLVPGGSSVDATPPRSRPAGTHQITENIDTTWYQPGTVLYLQGHVRTDHNNECYSEIVQVEITGTPIPPLVVEITDVPAEVRPFETVPVQWQCNSPSPLTDARLEWWLDSEPPGTIHYGPQKAPQGAGLRQFTDDLTISPMTPGDVINIAARVSNSTGDEVVTATERVPIVAYPFDCRIEIADGPTTAGRGEVLDFTVDLVSSSPVDQARLLWRYDSEPVEAERPGPWSSFPAGVQTVPLQVGPVGLEQGGTVLVRAWMQNQAGECFSTDVQPYWQVSLTAACTTDISPAPPLTLEQGDLATIQWNVTSALDITKAVLQRQWSTEPGVWVDGPVRSAAAGSYGFQDDVLIDSSREPGTVLTLRTYVETTLGITCQSPEYAITIEALSGADEYEEDNSCDDATPITTDGQHQTHTIAPNTDVDAVAFPGLSGETYVVETFPPATAGADTIVEVYDPDGLLVGSNDDKAQGEIGSRVQLTAAKDGTYCVLVRGKTRGEYDISVTNISTPPPPPPPPESTGAGAKGDDTSSDSTASLPVAQPSDGAVSVRIVSALIRKDDVLVVVAVTAPAELRSKLTVRWQGADGGAVRSTPAQTGAGSYRATFAVPSRAPVRLQACAFVNGAERFSNAVTVGGEH